MKVQKPPTLMWRLLPIGMATGALSGLLGVGGGVVMVPALVWVGYRRHKANAISLAVILVIALSGMVGFALSSAVDFPVGLAMGLGGVAGATGGARWAAKLSNRALARIFGILLLVTGVQMLFGGPGSAISSIASPWTLLIGLAIGAFAGIVSGLAGVGGGVIMVPAMVFLLGLGQHIAEGTSLLAICFTAAAATRVNVGSGFVEWRSVALVALGGVVTAPAAALFAQKIPADTLGRIFAAWLLLIAIRTLVTSRSSSDE